jgi:hypothetical protein
VSTRIYVPLDRLLNPFQGYINSVPASVHLSAHADGNAWDWKLLEKDGERPVIYSAGGSREWKQRLKLGDSDQP